MSEYEELIKGLSKDGITLQTSKVFTLKKLRDEMEKDRSYGGADLEVAFLRRKVWATMAIDVLDVILRKRPGIIDELIEAERS